MREHARRRARYLALESLYASETSEHDALGALERRVEQLQDDEPRALRRGADKFAREMLEGVLATIDESDRLISEAAPRYSLDSMAVVDRNILRLAIWELLADTSAPVAAVVNEAVELAHRYGGETSPGFVNGVLRTISAAILAQRPVTVGPSIDPNQSTPGE